VDDRARLREREEAAGGTLVDGPGLEIRDPWGNRLEVVEYRRVQFSKTDGVLEMLNTSSGKTEKAVEELRAKGVSGPRITDG